jgi:23S rRNA (cytidine1920-2'-O)/16S rRNA (cytidine1409-2'-O)-methyltransferase
VTDPKTKSAKSRAKVRADVLLVERGLAETLPKAQALLLAGKVFCGEQRIEKPGTALPGDSALRLSGGERFVSRGGYKLEGALEALNIVVAGWVCLDVGASTGGFTDCLLQRGASKVYAIDVGQGLLAHSLTLDARVVVRDKTNARHLEPEHFAEASDLVVADASFIGVEKLAGAFARVLLPGKLLLVMIKPQFEVTRAEARRAQGVIIDPELRQQAIEGAAAALRAAGFELLGGCDSVLAGPKGNVEYFQYARRL